MNLMFLGTGTFPLKTFQKLRILSIEKKIGQLSLTTILPKDQFNEKKKEKASILQFAIENEIRLHRLKNDPPDCWQGFQQEFMTQKPDIGIVCNFGLMVPGHVIDLFPKGIPFETNQGMYVIHPSLLPKYRGAAPIQRSLMAGDSQTGVSFIEISKNKFDAGKIIHQVNLDISPTDRYIELSQKLSLLTSESIEYFLTNLDELSLNGKPQLSDQVTTAPKIKPEESFANFVDKSATELLNIYRGLYSTNQSLRTVYKDKTMFLESVGLCNESVTINRICKELNDLKIYTNAQPGSIWVKTRSKKHFYVRCRGSWLRVEKFRYADRSLIQLGQDFINQYLNREEQQLDSPGIHFFSNK